MILLVQTLLSLVSVLSVTTVSGKRGQMQLSERVRSINNETVIKCKINKELKIDAIVCAEIRNGRTFFW